MTTDEFTIASGLLETGDGHSIWWHDWGNPKSKNIIFFLHGGPGSGCKDKYKLSFDPTVQRVVFHDQRGCGQSLPFGETTYNTTQHLVKDIEALRVKIAGNSSIMLTGGSWGSCLALAYAEEYPQHVSKMLLGGIFLGTREEVAYIQQGGLRTYYPEAWQEYIEVVPEEERHNTTAYYYAAFQKNNEQTPDYVRRWCLLEGTAMSLDNDYRRDVLKSGEIDETTTVLAKLEAHYFVNNCFLAENQLLQNASKLQDIPTVLMQGRHDHVCPPETAYKLAAAMGKNCHLHIMPGGHASELVTREVLRAYTFAFLTS